MAFNTSIIPSPNDLLMVIPRLAHKIGSLALSYIPDRAEENMMASDTATVTVINETITNITTTFALASASATANAEAVERGMWASLIGVFSFDGGRGFGGMFSYLGSRWSLATFAVVQRPP